MKQLFRIDESEKRRILEMHENATKRNYLMEQGTTPATSKTCFLADDTNQKSTTLSNNLFKDKVNEVCENLKEDKQFFVGRYYFVPDANNLTYKLFTIAGEGLAMSEAYSVKNFQGGWMIEGFGVQPVTVNLQSGKEKVVTEFLKNFVPGGKNNTSKNIDTDMYQDYLLNLASIDPNFKQTILKYKNFTKSQDPFISELTGTPVGEVGAGTTPQ